MKTRIIVAVIAVPVLFVILFFLQPVFLAALTAIICGCAAFEFTRAVCPDTNIRIKCYAVVSGAAIPFAMLSPSSFAITRGIIALFLLAVFCEGIWSYGKKNDISFEHILCCVFAGVVYPVMMSSLVSLKVMDNGKFFVLLPVVVTFCCDSGAYFAGVFFGKHKITPHVSPNKSAEGFVGGIVCGVLCMLIYGAIVALSTKLKVNFALLILYGVIGSAAVELGDLTYSLIKRQHGVKDYGNLIPGHGGMLDRFDSMSFSAPVICALAAILPVFAG